MRPVLRCLPVLPLVLLVACKGGGDECAIGGDDCAGGQVCEFIDGQEQPACVAPLFFTGIVFDAATGDPVAGALVSAVDENGGAAAQVVTTAGDGSYTLPVFSERAADENATPLQTFTLRAAAQDFQDFPFGVRPAIPISSGQAVFENGEFIVDSVANAAVDVALLALPSAQQGFPSISGNAEPAEGKRGVLVVAEAGGAGFSALSDLDGEYTIFNVPPNATYVVSALSAGIEYEPATVELTAEDAVDVNLALLATPTLTDVSGTVNIVNAPGGSLTSVVLIVESTFEELTGRGQLPPGLRAPENGVPDVTGAYTITGVPDGKYVALAAFENDALIRDPDLSIAGTQILHIDVKDGTITDILTGDDLSASLPNFKVTEALEIFSPGAIEPEEVTEPFTLSWADDSSEQGYDLVIFDAFGEPVFQATLPDFSGGGNPSFVYDSANPADPQNPEPTLAPGFYQFRVTSFTDDAQGVINNISQTEDLKGVFFVPSVEQP